MIILIFIAIIGLIMIGIIYQIKNNGVQITSGNIVVDINYKNDTFEDENYSIGIVEENSSLQNATNTSILNTSIQFENLDDK